MKKKIAAIKTLEEEIIDLEKDPAIRETVINKVTQFEITAKAKLNYINKFLSKAFPSQTKVKEQTTKTRNFKIPWRPNSMAGIY